MARDYDGGNTTGFVSPAGDSLEGPIDLSEILDLRRPHRYPVRVKGDALLERKRCGAAVLPGWVLIVVGLLEAGSFELTLCLTLTTTRGLDIAG